MWNTYFYCLISFSKRLNINTFGVKRAAQDVLWLLVQFSSKAYLLAASGKGIYVWFLTKPDKIMKTCISESFLPLNDNT